MPSVADALRQHGPEYLARFGHSMPGHHLRVLQAITDCRSGKLGHVYYQCRSCNERHWVGRSCGNRHCPACGQDKTQSWLAKQSQRLLPVHHFLVTFTVPDRVASVLRSHQSQGYAALFDVSSQALRDVAAETRALRGSQLGFFGVLHTWGRDPLVYHPHIHYVVPGGGVSCDGARWQPTDENFLVHHGTLIRTYKAKLADRLRELDLYDQIPASTWRKKFVVDIKPVGSGQAVLKYLAPYVHRVAISDHRIRSCDEQSVEYLYKPSGSTHYLSRSVSGEAFLRGFLQHSLPRGFQKIRYYGWMSPNNRTRLEEVRWLVWIFLGWTFWLGSAYGAEDLPATEATPVQCPRCGASMAMIGITFRSTEPFPEHAIAYLDSG